MFFIWTEKSNDLQIAFIEKFDYPPMPYSSFSVLGMNHPPLPLKERGGEIEGNNTNYFIDSKNIHQS